MARLEAEAAEAARAAEVLDDLEARVQQSSAALEARSAENAALKEQVIFIQHHLLIIGDHLLRWGEEGGPRCVRKRCDDDINQSIDEADAQGNIPLPPLVAWVAIISARAACAATCAHLKPRTRRGNWEETSDVQHRTDLPSDQLHSRSEL